MAENVEYYDGQYTGEEIDKAVTIALANKSYPIQLKIIIPARYVSTPHYDITITVPVAFSDDKPISTVCTKANQVSNVDINVTVGGHKINENGETEVILWIVCANVDTENSKTVILNCILSQIDTPTVEIEISEDTQNETNT